ncbi:GH12 family glycosyl hydrolase domain-containing protein [Azospirillum rugosum]|uniref:Glycosyl hydrolase family 12 n=1 Tax=Azospirillum rugosum TaxID=416170 RepID=A0ABS4SWY8_9PROT|nr:hypothetical protein [Azospirillum rugosum]MBP2296482.1 hypothetical protein [Azospirillum rugosum]MDQ0530003.1 hypothetical protein [Azospirillum rugosum]
MPTLSGNYDRFAANSWAVNANVWNPGRYQNGRDFTQTITIPDATIPNTTIPGATTQATAFPSGTTLSWNWPYDSGRALTYNNYPVRAYPELTYGASPWGNAPSTTVNLPARIGDVGNLDIGYNFGIAGDPRLYNVAFSLWISDDPSKGLAGVTDEVMVWVHSGYFSPAGQQVAKLTDQTGPATLWNKKVFSGGVDTNPVDWEYTVVKYDQDQLAGTFDVDALMKTLVDRGIVAKDDWLLGVQVGSEVTAGVGSLSIANLAVNFMGPPPPPTVPTGAPATPTPTPTPAPAPAALLTQPDSGIVAPPTLS